LQTTRVFLLAAAVMMILPFRSGGRDVTSKPEPM